MNRINELIKKACPQGVEYKQLGEVANCRRGSFPQPYGKSEWYNGVNAMPLVQVYDIGDNLNLKNRTKKMLSQAAQSYSIFAPTHTVLVTLQGSIGRVAITQYDSYIDRTIAIFENYKIQINKKYFAYQVQKIFKLKKEYARGTTIKTITKSEFMKFQIPIPPMEMQEEIVTILDLLNDNTNIILKELKELRIKQYNYYLNELTNFQ